MKKQYKLTAIVCSLSLSVVLSAAGCEAEETVCTHVWGDWETTAQATCTAEGSETRACTLCGSTQTQSIDALGHDYVDGVCTRCGDVQSDSSQTQTSTTQTVVSYTSVETTVYSTTAEVVAAVADSVVEISTETIQTQWGMQYIVSGAGSGVIVGQSGENYYIVTNDHVIEGANEITVTTRSGEAFEAELVATDDSADIAVIAIQSSSALSLAVWGNSDDLQVGEDLIAIGNPLGSLGGTVTKGILSATGRTITVGDYAMTLLQTDTAINPGNSGGGLFNMRGELIGIVNAKMSDEEVEGICFAIPSNSAKYAYGSLLEYGYLLGRASFPIELTEGTVYTSGVNAQSQAIVYVTSVSDAEDGTFCLYDRIYSINGVKITSILEYNVVLASIAPGDEVTVEVYRGTKSQSFWSGSSISFSSELTTFTVIAAQYGA